MKKIILTILIVSLVLCALTPMCAFAASSHSAQLAAGDVVLYSLVQDDLPYGISFTQTYFGAAQLDVIVQIYSSPAMDLSFFIGDSDLTGQQAINRNTIVTLFNEIHKFITQIDNCANTQYKTSDIYRYNQAKQGDRLEITKETYEMLQIARQMYVDTDGAFNPAVYRLVDLWGFSSRLLSYQNFTQPYDRIFTLDDFYDENVGVPLPSEKYIKAFSQAEFTDFSDTAVTLSQQDDKYFVTKNVAPVTVDGVEFDQWLDLGGIAKGYIVDGIKQMLGQLGLDRYYVSAGGSSTAYGLDSQGENQSIYTEDPFLQFTPLLGWQIGASSVSTSGQYIRKYTTNGVEYAHIIDGTKGAPAQTGLKAVTVVVPQSEGLWAGKGDCLTTALTVMGRDKVVEFINGYLKQHNVTVVAVYESIDGSRQILSNLDKQQIVFQGKNFDEYGWVLKTDSTGNFVYDPNVTYGATKNTLLVVAIVLASIVGAAVVALIVYYFVKGRKTALQKVQNARHDKPFKYGDVVVYLAVVLVVVVLFAAFFQGKTNNNWQTVAVYDVSNGEQLFLYNAVRDEWRINEENINGWKVEITPVDDGITVKLSRQFDGEERFNLLHIVGGANPYVKMEQSLCGAHQDCVRTFGQLTVPNGTIVCSPNLLKVVTK